jgi:outer membrane lipoprotein carrier protein
MTRYVKLLLFCLTAVLIYPVAMSQRVCYGADPGIETSGQSLDAVIDGIEKKYAGAGFSADFFQTSILKDMDITDTAAGRVFIQHPGRMRWEYHTPDRQTIISDGYQLWIYRPDDHQVMIGKAPSFFGDGKGASFLSDINGMRKNFHISLEKNAPENHYLLKLRPVKKTHDLSAVYLSISKTTFDVVRIVTLNSFGDETRIALSNPRFNQHFDDSLFGFETPHGTEIIQFDR